MSNVKIKGNASGTGSLTIEAPNTNTDRTLTLPDGSVELVGKDASNNISVHGIENLEWIKMINSYTPAGSRFQVDVEGTSGNQLTTYWYDGSWNKLHNIDSSGRVTIDRKSVV